MKIIDLLVEKSLLTSIRFVNAVREVHDLAVAVHALAQNVHRLTQIVIHHDQILRQFVDYQQDVMQEIKDDSPDMSLPLTTKDEINKPN